MARSTYDDLHDKFDPIDTAKAGTRYERLVAIAQKALDDTACVVHDVRLVGDSEVKHQIDVTITRGTEARRILIECKDYDVSGDDVGLGTIRNFFGVVDDVKPDEAFVITCNGFTAEARRYAKAKNIKLAVLRNHRPEDDVGRLQGVHIDMELSIPHDYRATIRFQDERGKLLFTRGDVMESTEGAATVVEHADRQTDTYLHGERRERRQLVEALDLLLRDPRFRAESSLPDGRRQKEITLRGCSVQRDEGQLVPINGFLVSYSIHVEHRTLLVTSPVAALVLAPVGDGTDLLIFEETLRRYRIDPETGEVRTAADS